MFNRNIKSFFKAIAVFGIFLPPLSFADTLNLKQTSQITEPVESDMFEKLDTGKPSVRFIDNIDGTITDTDTNLIWLKDGNCFGGKIWQRALDAIERFNKSPETFECADYTGNNSDWRLPTINELRSLVNRGEPDRYIWLKEKGFKNIKQLWYWTGTEESSSPVYALSVSMKFGSVGLGKKETSSRRVLPVRSSE